MSDIVCITSLLDILRFAMSIVTIIYSTYFTCLLDSNERFLVSKLFPYVIILLPILCKQLVTVFQGTESSPNSKQSESHTPLTAGFLCISIYLFRLGQLSSFSQKSLFCFDCGFSNSLVTVDVYCSDEVPYPDSMKTNSQ